MDLNGKVAVVTGAGSGIGRALSLELARRGASVAACDLNEAAAEATVSDLNAIRSGTHQHFVVDVSIEDSVERTAEAVRTAFGQVDVLVNNAGVLGQMAPISDLTTEELQWVIGIDLWGVIFGTRAYLPMLKARPEAALVNVSSLAGLMGSMGNAAYFTAKFGVRGFSEAVRAELRSTGVKVTIVFPGVVRTNLGASHFGYSEAERKKATELYHAQPGVSPEHAAVRIVKGIQRGKPRVLVGPDSRGVDALVRLMPGSTDRLLHSLVAKMVNKQRPDGREVFH